MQSVRPDAPWCPSNIEFIRRINGLDSVDDVHRIVFDASYLVLGLGDVYLGAPVATPVDPRHRLVTTKYNRRVRGRPKMPSASAARIMCVYGMEGPGGYQFVGRTVQMWNRRTTRSSSRYSVAAALLRSDPLLSGECGRTVGYREAFPHGAFEVRTEETDIPTLCGSAGRQPSSSRAAGSVRRRARAMGRDRTERIQQRTTARGISAGDDAFPKGARPCGRRSLQACGVSQSNRVNEWRLGSGFSYLEAMKMEVAVAAPQSGVVEELRCSPGGIVNAGQNLLVFRAEAGR